MKILSPGNTILSRYKVIAFVGEGGMQEVYRATDLAFNRTVALKTPKNDHASKRFQRSAMMSARVRHPAVAATFDYFEENGRAYLVEEFNEGVDLKHVMATKYFYLDPALACHVAIHVAKGLQACHGENIWHRDLKPANIMVSGDLSFTEVKITDFGISKMVAEEFVEDAEGNTESSITSSQTLVGAAPYMAPEHMFTPKHADKRADIWSFGAILYSLMFGEAPFGRNFANIAAAYSTGGKVAPPPPWMLAKGQFSESLDLLWKIVQSCLVKDPGKRPTADELVECISNICFSIYPREKGRTKGVILYRGSASFVCTFTTDVSYHIDSYFKEGKLTGGIPVAFSRHPGYPSERAFPVVPLREY